MLSLTVPVPCIRGCYGKRLLTFQTMVKPSEIVNLLGHDPRSKNWNKLPADLKEMYLHLQRKTKKGRWIGTARYIRERIAPGSVTVGAFPALAIGMVKPPQFESYEEDGKHIQKEVGILKLDLSANNKRVLLDGLARITGAMDLIEEGKTEYVDCFTFPVTIFAPSPEMGDMTIEQLGQLFHDFNFLAEPVSKSQAIALDQSDIYITMTNHLAEAPVIKERGGMEKRSASLGAKSTALVAQPVLLRFVRGACEGSEYNDKLRQTPENPNLTIDTFEQLKGRIEWFIEGIATRMGQKFHKERDFIHLTAPGWYALSLVFHDMEFTLRGKLSSEEKEEILTYIANIDWSRYNQDWLGHLGNAAEDADGNPIKDNLGRLRLGKSFGGGQAVTWTTDYIRNKTGLKAKLAAVENEHHPIVVG